MLVLEGGDSDLPVDEVATTDPLDYDHALGVIAEGIAQEDFPGYLQGSESERVRVERC